MIDSNVWLCYSCFLSSANHCISLFNYHKLTENFFSIQLICFSSFPCAIWIWIICRITTYHWISLVNSCALSENPFSIQLTGLSNFLCVIWVWIICIDVMRDNICSCNTLICSHILIIFTNHLCIYWDNGDAWQKFVTIQVTGLSSSLHPRSWGGGLRG